MYNFEIGGHAAKVISDGRLLFAPPDVFQDDPFLITRALEENFQSGDPVIFEVRVDSIQSLNAGASSETDIWVGLCGCFLSPVGCYV